ncbi:hypothetical protein C8J57DRAFT_1273957 [Mycena rebaudengoi]|nr:hypothetical protein C8J57DRAFT_1273957 [Mycena rebaudengoi]
MAKSTAKYTLIPDADEDDRLLASPAEPDSGDESDSEPLPRASPREQLEPDFPPTVDPRFIQPTPALWKRAGVIFLTFFLFWLFFQIQASRKGSRSKVIYANRYSKEHKFRPAASPIITEILKDGRTRIRGAAPTTMASTIPTPTTKPKTGKKKTKRGGKKVHNNKGTRA